MSPRGRALSWLANLVVLGLACLVALGLGEWMVRSFAPQEGVEGAEDLQPRGFYAAHPPLAFTMNPAFRGRFRRPEFDTRIAIDSLGIRDRERGPRAPEVRRILVLGDSYTFGWGVEAAERYTARLEQRLAADSALDRVRWEVIPAGVNSYGTGEELAWLGAFGWRLDPNLLVLQFCMGNDFSDNVGPGYHVENGFLVTNHRPGAAPRPRSPLARFRRWLLRHSELANFLRDRWIWMRRGTSGAERVAGDLRQFNRTVDRGACRTRALLGEMAAEARARGVPLVVLIVPMRHQIYEYADADPPSLRYPNRVLRAACDSLGVPVIDLLDPFRAAARDAGERLYFRRDRHWTVAGHRLAGDALHDSLRAGGLLTGPAAAASKRR